MKFITTTLAIALLIGPQMNAAAGPPQNAPCRERAWIPRVMPTAEKEWRVVRLAECAAAHWWPGHARTLLTVAWRESHYDPYAANPTSSARGLYQGLLDLWAGRVQEFLRPEWFRAWPPSWTNARAATIVATRMMAAQGSPCPAWCVT